MKRSEVVAEYDRACEQVDAARLVWLEAKRVHADALVAFRALPERVGLGDNT